MTDQTTPAAAFPAVSSAPAASGGVAFADVDSLVEFLRTEAGRPGERSGFSALDHGLQCAFELATAHPYDLDLQVAGLVHDIGHRLVQGDDAGHGRHGADAVRALLGDRVADLVALHVPAKRYLVTVDPSYADHLSEVSTDTLSRQGGRMTDDEVEAFLAHPHAIAAVDLRRADEAAKIPGRVVPALEQWIPALISVAGRAR